MAVVIKNTFLDVADHKFLYFDEPCGASRRCQSVPHTFKPSALSMPKGRSCSPSTQASTQGTPRRRDSFCSISTHARTASGSSASEMGLDEPRSPQDSPTICMECAPGHTELKREAPPFQPVAADTRMDAVVNAVYLLLASSGQIGQIKVEQGLTGQSPTLISAELQRGPQASTRCYEVMQLVKQTLSSITTQLPTAALLSARVQKEESGYSMRSSVACVPESAQDKMCWDTFRTGYCPRRSQCRWYHPESSDIGKVKVVIKFAAEMKPASSEAQHVTGSSKERHQISLGELLV